MINHRMNGCKSYKYVKKNAWQLISDSIIYGMSRKKLYIPYSLCYTSEGDFMGSKNEDNNLLDVESLNNLKDLFSPFGDTIAVDEEEEDDEWY